MNRIRYKAGYKYQLVEDYYIQTEIRPAVAIKTEFIELSLDGLLLIRKHYAWDGPSGPTVDTPSFMRGSLVHDAFYQLMRMRLLALENQLLVDQLLRQICLEDGMLSIRAWWVYQGVRFGGESCASSEEKPPLEAP